MIPIFDEDKKTRLSQAFNGIIFNDPTDAKNDLLEVDRIRSRQQFESIIEPRSRRDGLEAYQAFKRVRHIRFIGTVRAPSKGRLYDRIEELAAACDPALLSHQNPDTNGFLPLDFSIPTGDLIAYPTGLMACRYYVRPSEAVEPEVSRYSGLSVPFLVDFLAADPRRYLQAASSHDGDGVADNSAATYPSWPTITITLSGAGSASFAIGNDNVGRTLELDLSGLSGGDVVTIDMEGRMAQVNGVDTPSLIAGGDFWWMEPGANVLTVTDGTNTTITTVWRSAFSF